MSTPVRQTNLSGGELSPLLYGRTDLEVFGRGLRKCRNFFVSRHGAAVSRPGMMFVDRLYGGDGGYTRLVPFIYSDTQSYVLVFTGLGALEIYSYAAGVLFGGSALTHPYSKDDLKAIQWTQSGDVMTVTHPDHTPRELKRLAHNNWTITPISFDRPAAGLGNIAGVFGDEDATHPAREWAWAFTALRKTADTGVLYESAPAKLVPAGKVPVYPDKTASFSFATPPSSADPNFVAIRCYRGRGGLYGWVADVTGGSFTDVGGEPDYTMPPPQGLNPFVIYDAAGTPVRTEKPAATTYFQGRLCFGGTAERPGWVFESAVEDYKNFDERLVVTDDMPILFELASRTRQEIRALVGLRHQLLIGTNAAWWAGAFTLEKVDFTVIDEIGTSRIPVPLVIDNAVLFARTKGTGARALRYSEQGGGFEAHDLSFIAHHLFTGITKYLRATTDQPISDWAYAEDPWGVVWAARSDGKLLSLTYAPEQNIAAWALHETNGKVLSVCSVPEGDEDAVYLAVERPVFGGTITVLERMSSRIEAGSVEDNICLDLAAKVKIAPALGVTPTPQVFYAGRTDLWVVAKQRTKSDHAADGATTKFKTVFEFSANADVLVKVLTSGGAESTKVEGVDYTLTGAGVAGGGTVTFSAAPAASGKVTIERTTPLERFQVWGPLAADSTGTVTLPEIPEANSGTDVVLYVGLKFTPELETLDVAHTSVRNKPKRVIATGFEVDSGRGLWAGEDTEKNANGDYRHMHPWRQREVKHGYNAVPGATDYIEIPVSGTWNKGGRAILLQDEPLPVTVLGIIRQLDIGDDER